MLAARIAGQAGTNRYGPENIAITGGTSAALDQLAGSFARSGRAVLTEALTYDFGREIFAGWGLEVIAVPGPADDVDIAQFRSAARQAARSAGIPPAIYLIPTFHNPTGRTLPAARRAEILAVAAETGALIVEDLAYAELGYSASPPPPPLWATAADPGQVISLYSFAKCLAPGLRLGWLAGSEERVAELAATPVRVSGGGPNHLTATAVMAGLASGEFGAHVSDLRGQLKTRRDSLVTALRRELPDGCTMSDPGGGFFVWVTLPAGIDAEDLLREATSRGVSFALGTRFGGSAGSARLCFAGCSPQRLTEGASLFGEACKSMI